MNIGDPVEIVIAEPESPVPELEPEEAEPVEVPEPEEVPA